MSRRGWHFESRRHAKAAKGIRTKGHGRFDEHGKLLTEAPKTSHSSVMFVIEEGKFKPLSASIPEKKKASGREIPPSMELLGETDEEYVAKDKLGRISIYNKKFYHLPEEEEYESYHR